MRRYTQDGDTGKSFADESLPGRVYPTIANLSTGFCKDTVKIGRQAMDKLPATLRAQGIRELFIRVGQGEASPEGFYRKPGFFPTGDMYGDEIESVLKLN